jgi:ribosome production factor 1
MAPSKPKGGHPSLQGKKPGNTARVKRPTTNNPGHIKNKLKRSEMYGKYLLEKKAAKRQTRIQREKEAVALGEDAAPKRATPRTLDNTRESEATAVQPDDEEVLADEAEDEFAKYFSDSIRPKILLTTRPCPSAELFHFISDLMRFIPQLFYYPRKSYSVKEICTFGSNRKFTHLIVLSEKSKVCNGMLISHLRPSEAGNRLGGPTAFFKVSNVIPSTDVPNNGSATSHVPELNLHGFTTRLGHRAGRFLGSLFPHNAQFRGRQVATFHNQRDFIFVRHHRYVFEEGTREVHEATGKKKTKARLQELGPRFTMKMRWLQEGTFDTQFGEYEWFHKRKEMDTTRRKFHL